MSIHVDSAYGKLVSSSQNKKKSNNMSAAMGGILAAQGVTLATVPVNMSIMNKMTNVAKTDNPEELRSALNKALEISGMDKKGVKIVDLSVDKSIEEDFKYMLDKSNKINKFFIKQNPLYQAAQGKNAAFCPISNQVYVDVEKMGHSGFHEIGHSINANTSKLLRTVQYCRPLFLAAAGLLTAIAVMKKPKKEGEKPKGIIDNVTTFIKNNVGKLAALTTLPVFAEEMIATSRGTKLAREVLKHQPQEVLSKVIKTNKYGAITYGLAVIGAGVGAWLANKVADKIRG